MNEYDLPFEPSSSVESAGVNEPNEDEPINVCRAAALGATLGPRPILEGLGRGLVALGMPERLSEVTWSWEEAIQGLDNGSPLWPWKGLG